MHLLCSTLLLLLSTLFLSTLAMPAEQQQPQKRQADLSELLALATLAGITALPTDPAVLLSLGPIAATLASALPTAPVLSVLETAAPSGFLSQIVHDPAFAASFESAFAAGSSPSWFNALPTDVKSYLHTYTNFGGIATAVGEVEALTANATATATGASGSETGSLVAQTTGVSSAAASAALSSLSAALSSASAAGSSAATVGGNAAPSSTSAGGAAQTTGVLTAGIVGVFGVLGLAIAL